MEEKNFELPSHGELVVCKVTKVLDYGVFAELLDYNNAKGFIHISQVASGWIKNIRNFVSEGQVRIAQVLAINTEKNQIDLSFTKVSSQAQKARLEEWKQLRRAKKMLEILAKQTNKSFEQAWDAVAEPLIEEYGSLHKAFQQIALDGAPAAKNIESNWVEQLVELVKKTIEVPERTVKGTLTLSSMQPNGVEAIKEAIKKGLSDSKEKNIAIYYLGSGKYLVKATAVDFKKAEKSLNNAANSIVTQMKSAQGTASFEKTE